MSSLVRFQVGESAKALKIPMEGGRFDLTDSGAMLTLGFDTPTSEEISDFRFGKLKFALAMEKDVIFFLAKIGSMNWVDMPYNVHLSQLLESPLVEVKEGNGLSLNMFFVDVRKQIIQGIRTVGLPTNITNKLFSLVEKQKEMPFNKVQYDIHIQQIYNTYTVEKLLDRSVIRTY